MTPGASHASVYDSTPEKLCEIAGCIHPILSRHRQDAGGHLCAPHFFALAVLEGRHEPLGLPEGPRRRWFINAVTILSDCQRAKLLAWRGQNPAPPEGGEESKKPR